MLTLEFIREAERRIASRVHRTPVMSSRAFNSAAGGGREVFFKCENFQRAGAFKMRGATNKILALDALERARGVAAFSSGNHAQAVALAARDAGTRACIVMPEDAPRAKVAATRGYGAEVVFYDRQRDDRERVARDVAERNGLVLVPPYDDYHVMAGQGTCALELMEEVQDLDAIVVPCGGGGLFAGASTAARGLNARIRCFAVEPATGDDTRQSLLKGERVTIPPPPTIADGARVQTPGALTFHFVMQNADDVLTVTDAETAEAMKFLLFRLKILVEPTGALAAAAVLFDKLPRGLRRIGVVLTGGNVDADVLARLAVSIGGDGVGSDNGAEQMLK
ncbi:MAG TPA: pyridoxal-phosphate dependent enzyme [Pyrinomonadaceae bacterium]|nr:pyridoxal-phosphate dependent enzyme [Pyrinomonadaceae bacterium]